MTGAEIGLKEKYAPSLMTAEEAVDRFVRPGDRIFLAGSLCASLTEALRSAVLRGDKDGVTLDGPMCLGGTDLTDPALSLRGARYKSYFFGGAERAACRAGTASYVPLVYSSMARHYKNHPVDVCFLEVTPPDENGMCNVGCILSGVAPSAAESAGVILAGVNPRLTRAMGRGVDIPAERITAFVPSEHPMPEFPAALPDETDRKISDLILEQVPDGACLQLGIGGMPNALGYGLRVKKHLGIHTELLTPSLIELIRCGAVDNSRKAFMPGVSVCGFFMGEREQYDFINGNRELCFMPNAVCNDPQVIASNDNVVSVNNALEADLCGAVAADCVGFRQYSGVGGQPDFVRGAAMSRGGNSFIAMRSVYYDKAGRAHSRIVSDLSPGTQVTTSRADTMNIVTEYGCARLWDEDVPTRAERLIAVAHPDFRDALRYDARRAGLLY